MSKDIKAIQDDLVNAGSYRTHRIKREKYPRFSQIFWDASLPQD